MDTSFLVAYYHADDKNHARAVELLENLEGGELGSLIISDYVFDETITLLKKYIGNKKATGNGEGILDSMELILIDREIFGLVWELSKKLDRLSFTDCSNIALMKKYGIAYLAAFDSDFDGIVNVVR